MKRNIIVLMLTVLAVTAMLLTSCTGVSPLPSVTSTPAGENPVSQGTMVAPSSPDLTTPAPSNGSNEEQLQVQSTPIPPTGNEGSQIASVPAASTGKLEIRVTDAPAKEEITSILVTVNSLEIHKLGSGETQQAKGTEPEEGTQESEDDNSGGWTTIEIDEDVNEFDLLKVKENPEMLASLDVETGYYKIKIGVEKVVITFGTGDAAHKEIAKVPSGKIKFNQAFEVTEDGITDLLFDFDAAQSVNVTGNGKVMFKPVIKLSVSQKNNKQENEENIYIITRGLPDGIAGEDYGVTLKAKGGKTPYIWSITEGELPEDLKLNKDTGKISGELDIDSAGEYEFTIKVQDADDDTLNDTLELTLVIYERLEIITDELPDGIQGLVYKNEDGKSVKLEAIGGSLLYTWSVSGLPEGLELDEETGIIFGIPTESGEFEIEVTVTDSSEPTAQTDAQILTISIAAEEEIEE